MHVVPRFRFLMLLSTVLATLTNTLYSQLFIADAARGHDLPSSATVLRVSPSAFAAALATPEVVTQRHTLPLPSGTVPIVVQRFEVFDDATVVNLITANGPVRFVPQKQLFLRGRIDGVADSRVMLAVLPDQVYGIISMSGRQLYIQPYHQHTGTSICFAAVDAKHPAPWTCAQESLTDQPPIPPMPPTPPMKKGGADQQQRLIRTLPLGIEGDYDMYLDHGQNAAKAVAYAEAVTAASSDIYFRDVDAKLRVKRFELWTVNDPYTATTSDGMLTQFRDRWRTMHGNFDRATAVLLSGVNTIGGVAYVNVLCSKQNGYAVVGLNNNVNYPATGYVWDTDVMSHELGHNIGSLHTHSCTWAPPIDSCVAAENGNCYAGTKPVRGTIMSYCHLTNQGTSLEFHPRVVSLLSTRISNASCREMISSLAIDARPDTTVCHGDTIRLTSVIDGGTGPFTVTWTGPNIIEPSGPNPRAVVTSTATYRVTVVDAISSQATDTVRISTSTLPLAATITAPQRVCPNSPTTIVVSASGGTGAYRYTWTVNDVTTTIASASHTFTPSDSLSIVVRVRDAQDCSTFVQTVVTLFERPSNRLMAPAVACVGDTVTIQASPRRGTPPYVVVWRVNGMDAGVLDTTLRFPIRETTVVRCMVTDSNLCADTMELTVRVRSTQVQFAPPRVTLPEIPACLDYAVVDVHVRNSGSDTAYISGLSASIAQATIESNEQPFVVAPGEQRALGIRVRVPIDVDVRDTLRFHDARCSWVYLLPIEGRRGTLVSDLATGVELGILAACEQGITRQAVLRLRNGSPRALTITQFRAEGVDSITAAYPITINGRGVVSVPVRLHGISKALMSIPAVRAEYISTGCEGSVAIPVSVTVAPYNLSVPGIVDFGVVRQGAPVAQRSMSIIPAMSTGLEQLEITGVAVSGPFEVSDLQGARLRGGRATVATVAFRPSTDTPIGEVRGSVAFTVDSCSAETTIPLRAWLDDGVSVQRSENSHPRIVYQQEGHAIAVEGVEPCLVQIFDLQGRLLLSSPYAGSSMVVPPSIRGVVAVSVECVGGVRLRQVLSIR